MGSDRRARRSRAVGDAGAGCDSPHAARRRAAVPGDHRRAARQGAGGRRQEQPLLLQHAAADLRRHLAVRRRVHHLQHVLHHDRATTPRAGPAPITRRKRTPGGRVGGVRGARGRDLLVDRRVAPRARHREAARGAVERVRDRSPDRAPAGAAAHDHRVPAGGNARDPRVRARAGTSSGARPARSRHCATRLST